MLDTLLLKQKKLPILDITGFFFHMSTRVKVKVHQGLHLSTAGIYHTTRLMNEGINYFIFNCSFS
jgi:hypothetical protein